MVAKQVYCGRCRWHDSGGAGYPADDCMFRTGYRSDYATKKITLRTDGEPSVLNENNDCAYYSWNWFGFLGF